MSAIRWFHSFEFADGQIIDGIRPLVRLKQEANVIFRHSVAGKSVLDIGAWDGYFSFEAERRGAASVLATDHFCWSGPGWGTKAGFDYVHARLASKVQSRDIDVFDLSPKIGTFDVVLFLGVLYHLKNPLGGLEIVAKMTRQFAVIETEADALDIGVPVMRFYKGTELNNDPTNFWAPNLLCLDAMLLEAGFRHTEVAYVEPLPRDAKRWRVVVHAFK